MGRRDYAILVLLARLGLRAAEVAVLRLDDIDWRAGQIVVRGKGRTEELLPLPPDVGSAIAAYLRRCRPQRPEREVLLRVNAPLRGLTPAGVSEVVRAASERAGLGSFGAHRLRHTAGTEMLREAGLRSPNRLRPPRAHDLRHTFAVRTLIDWCRQGLDAERRMPLLSTWLGHVDPGSTYWYLTGVPELLELVADRLDAGVEGGR